MSVKTQVFEEANSSIITGDSLAPHIDPTLPTRDSYRLDPWAHVDAGHVIIEDVVTMQPVIWTPYPHQREAIDTWMDLDHLAETAKLGRPVLRFRNVVEEKSRQMGLSWALAWAILWTLMYHRISILGIHEDLTELDDGGQAATTESLFGRILYMANGEIEVGESVWPDQYKPTYLTFRSRPSLIRNTLRTGSHFAAVGQGPTPGRGHHYGAILLDEAARIPWSEAVHASTKSACPRGRFYNSTPEGTSNAYGRLVKDRPKDFRFLRHHWSVHPLYGKGLHVAGAEPETCALCLGNQQGETWRASDPTCHRYPGKLTSPWYEDAINEMTDQEVAQELEIDYSGALTGRIYPEFTEDVHVLPEIPYDDRLPILTAWDYGVGTTAIAILQETPLELLQIGELEVHDAIPDNVVPALLDTLADLGVPLQELEPQFTREWLGVGDPAGDARTPTTGEPLTTAYAKLGFVVQSRKRSIDETIRATKRLLQGRPKEYRISAATCPLTIEHWRENRWPTDREGVVSPKATEPKNDRHNHMMRAIAYLTTWLYPAPSLEEVFEGASSGAEHSLLDEMAEDARDGNIVFPEFDGGGLSPDMGF